MHLVRTLLSWGLVVAVGPHSALFAQLPVAQQPVAVPPISAPAATREWQVLEPPGEGFRLELPGRTESQSAELDTQAGKIHVRSYVLNDEPHRRTYQATANQLPKASTDLETLLNRTRDGAVRSIQAKLLDERKLPLEPHAGRALTLDAGGGRFVFLRLYATGNRLYQVSVVSDAAQPTADDQRVLSSFQFRDAAPTAEVKPDWRFVTPRGEKLAVQMPADPQETNGLLDTPLGRVKLTRLECTSAGRTYFVQICDWPQALVGDVAVRLDAARDHALQATSGKLVSETPLTVGERTGRAAVIAAGERTFRLHTLVDGPRVYQLGTVGGAEQHADEKQFLESLKLPAPVTK